MRKVSSEYCKFTGITEEYWYDEQTRKLTIKRYQDVEHTLAMNRVMYNEHASKKPVFHDVDGIYQVARIPTMVIEKWLREEGFNWYKSTAKEKAAKLNDPDYRYLRVRPGKV